VAFAAAVSLDGLLGIERPEVPSVTYHHLLFDRHEVVFAEGTPTESLLPSAPALDAFTASARDEVLTLFPELRTAPGSEAHATARPVLRRVEARCVLVA
jgi:hypothetical protein